MFEYLNLSRRSGVSHYRCDGRELWVRFAGRPHIYVWTRATLGRGLFLEAVRRAVGGRGLCTLVRSRLYGTHDRVIVPPDEFIDQDTVDPWDDAVIDVNGDLGEAPAKPARASRS